MKIRTLVSGSDLYNTQMLYFTCSSLSLDNRRLYLISDRDGSSNVYVRDIETGSEQRITQNTAGYQKSYVYFDGEEKRGLGKASVCLDVARDIIYYIQDNCIYKAGAEGGVQMLAKVPDNQVTAFTHVSSDGSRLCVPGTDERALDFDPVTEGSGVDRRPVYSIDGRVQEENLSSYLNVFDTQTGALLYSERVPNCWITHVQFHPTDNSMILYNHEWPSVDCGMRRMWIYNGKEHICVRPDAPERSRHDWVCHEMWASDGRSIIYHGAGSNAGAFVGRYYLDSGEYSEISLPREYTAYGHFTIGTNDRLTCDGYYRRPDDVVRASAAPEGGPDPHKKNAEYITVLDTDWDAQTIIWHPLCKHETDWRDQDSHPHAIMSHDNRFIYFTSRCDATTKVFRVEID